jgi:hypothetical protein
MDLRVSQSPVADGWEVSLTVSLDRRETNELFLAGDKLVTWPTGLVRPFGSGPIDRTSMFLSEIVARPEGLRLVYESMEAAQTAAKVLESQIRSAVGG